MIEKKRKFEKVFQESSMMTNEYNLDLFLRQQFPCQEEGLYEAMSLYILTNIQCKRPFNKFYDDAKSLLISKGYV